MLSFTHGTVLAAAAMLTASTAGAQMMDHAKATTTGGTTIVDVAAGAGFNTLVAAVKAVGLADALKGPGPFTVFAPTDAAFAKLPAGTLDALLKDPARLAAILKYHVVSGTVMAADVLKAGSAKPATLNGAALDVVVKDGRVHVNGATVVKADVMASNGVIHVIDAVVLPPAGK
jgi:uncharacterized surface protein with fasciclin (FAS1) repeats